MKERLSPTSWCDFFLLLQSYLGSQRTAVLQHCSLILCASIALLELVEVSGHASCPPVRAMQITSVVLTREQKIVL